MRSPNTSGWGKRRSWGNTSQAANEQYSMADRVGNLVDYALGESNNYAANLAFVAFSRALGGETGHVAAIFVIALAAAEACVGLALAVALFRAKKTSDLDDLRELKG